MVINGISGGSSLGSYINSSSSSTSGLEEFLATLGVGIGFIIFVWILINILFLIIVGKIAKSKGLNAVLWSILALIFGFPIFIIVLLLPKYNNQTIIYNNTTYNQGYSYNRSSQQNKNSYLKRPNTSNISGVKWRCSSCGELNLPGAQNCINCYAPNANLSPSKRWTCPSCGEINVSSAAHCINCFTTNPRNRKPTVSRENMWTCPNCGEKNVEIAKNCINCFTEKPKN